jgi:threonine/homoserine/homoserine lactone efflux protein
MISNALWQGVAVGFLAALPLGPMGMLALQRTLQLGPLAGFASACGLTLASSLWCVMAAMGLSRVAELVTGHEALLTVGLGLFLVTAGILGLRRGQGALQSPSTDLRSAGPLTRQFFSSMLGVILNPILFVTMSAVLAILGGVRGSFDVSGLAALGAGVLAGGVVTWGLIIQGTLLMKHRFGEAGGLRLSRVLNYAILCLGVIYLVRPFIPDSIS